MKIFWFLGVFGLLLLSNACIEEIPVQPGSPVEKLVVSGILNNVKENQIIKLQMTTGYGQPPYNIENAEVILYENKINKYSYVEQNQGKYVLESDKFTAKIGAEYYITISLPNGKKYQSLPEIMLESIAPDSLSWDITTKNEIILEGYPREYKATSVFLHTSLPNNDPDICLRWISAGAFQFTTLPECNPFRSTNTCYFSNELQPGDPMIYSNEELRQNRLNRFEIAFETMEPDYKFMEIHYFIVNQYRISKKAYTYFKDLKSVSSLNGSIFDAVPASVKGNVYNAGDKNEYALGYFQVSAVVPIRLKLVASDFAGKYALLSKTGNLCAWLYGNSQTYFQACCDCSLPDPIISKPDWW